MQSEPAITVESQINFVRRFPTASEAMVLEDQSVITATPERIYEFFEHIDEHYLAWHPDHVAFRWTKGQGLKPGVETYFEEYIRGNLLKKGIRSTKIEPGRFIEFEPTWWLMRLFLPRLSFEIRPQGETSLLIARITLRIGPLAAWLKRRELDAVRQHMHEEGQNLNRMLTARHSTVGDSQPPAVRTEVQTSPE